MDNVVATENLKHTLLEDILALLIGSLMVSFGIILLRQSGTLTGGTAGMAFLLSDVHPLFIHFDKLQPFYATLFGNIIIGLGFIVLFRHKASLGGVNILALYLQDHDGIRAGKFQMAVDVVIVLASLFVVSIPMLVVSVVGAVIINLIIAMNHRPGRYTV